MISPTIDPSAPTPAAETAAAAGGAIELRHEWAFHSQALNDPRDHAFNVWYSQPASGR
ncbi:MAG: hypothetical protein RL409_51, partial [Gemmatimonadota bacterium]